MKVNKAILKTIVKECLIEILSEGINAQSFAKKPQQKLSTQYESTDKEKRAVQINENISQAVKNIAGNDPIMASIFADTAARAASMNEGSAQQTIPLDSIGRFVDSQTPTEIFGKEMTDKWSELVFNKSK